MGLRTVAICLLSLVICLESRASSTKSMRVVGMEVQAYATCNESPGWTPHQVKIRVMSSDSLRIQLENGEWISISNSWMHSNDNIDEGGLLWANNRGDQHGLLGRLTRKIALTAEFEQTCLHSKQLATTKPEYYSVELDSRPVYLGVYEDRYDCDFGGAVETTSFGEFWGNRRIEGGQALVDKSGTPVVKGQGYMKTDRCYSVGSLIKGGFAVMLSPIALITHIRQRAEILK